MRLGHVYVLEFCDNVKIGRTIEPQKRIDAISTSKGERPTRVFVTDKCSNYYKVEVLTHKQFKENRALGEYFNCNYDEVVLFLSKVALDIPTKEEIDKENKESTEMINRIVKEMHEPYNKYLSKPKEVRSENRVHCEFCLIPINDFVKNDMLSCEEYSNLLDIKNDFVLEGYFLRFVHNEGYRIDKLQAFKDIQEDIGDWY